MPDHQPSSLQTKVAGRLASLFLFCAGLPLAAIAVLTIARTSGELSSGATARLRYEASTLEQEALNRLHRLAEGLQSLTRAMELDDSASLRGVKLADHLPVLPRAGVVRLSDGKTVRLAGELPVPKLSGEAERHLLERGRLLASNGQQPLMIVSGMRRRALAAVTVDEDWVFGLQEPNRLPPDSAACVATNLRQPACSIAVAPDVMANAIATFKQANTIIATPSGPQRAWVSVLDLAAYHAPSWRFVLMRPQAVIRQPLASFVRDMLIVLVLTGLAVAWVTLRQVRRHLKPLAALTAATTRLRRHELDHTVDVESDDEFGLLGEAFNQMAADLRDRFADLEAFNIGTLTTLARAIDAKSPWTAGHSERVTTVAVMIARSLDLPQAEVDLIRKGGLVHDIGKIATPLEILDKSAPLTPEEERVMRLHPEQGVHILEPIPAFKPLLPIIGQHHERWDGCGYPARLAAEAIARPARVVAVADVYDALRSDRPYRTGMPHARVVNIIRNGAGKQFDPDVVSAFLAIQSAIGDAVTAERSSATLASA